MGVRVDDLSFRYPGTERDALSQVSFEIVPGHPLAVLGEFGAGKSTLLRILAGLEAPNAGTITFDDSGPVGPEFLRDNVSMVFQNYALMPNLSIEQNIALHRAGGSKSDVAADVRQVASLLGLDSALNEKARELAPSQRMRVAFARALVRRPSLLLLDEPLAHLDNTFSTDLRTALASAIVATGVPTLLVTEDADEAASLGGPTLVLHEGRLQGATVSPAQDSSPEVASASEPGVGRRLASLPRKRRDVRDRHGAGPSSSYESDDEAYVNHLPVEVGSDGRVHIGVLALPMHVDTANVPQRIHAAVRSVDFDLVALGDGLPVDVTDVGFDGGSTTIFGRCRVSDAVRPVRLEIKLAGDSRRLVSATVAVAPRSGSVRLVDRATNSPIPAITIES